MQRLPRRFSFRWFLLATILGATTIATGAHFRSSWRVAGQNLRNTRHQWRERAINPTTVANLSTQWVFETKGDVSATPAVDRDAVYFPDWGGHLWKVDRDTGELIWGHPISDYNDAAASVSRVTPAITRELVILGDQGGGQARPGARMFAVDRRSGARRWTTLVEEHPAAIITQSPVVFRNRVYVGVSSNEEALAEFVPGYPCCSFRGSVVALDARSGEILWKTYMAPETNAFPPYSGNAVWGSTPAIDWRRGQLYVATGNNYTVPQTVLDCVDDPSVADPRTCNDPANRFDAVVALDLRSGEVRWGGPLVPFDSWTVACLFGDQAQNPENCQSPTGPDHDFGQGPALFRARHRQLVGAGQKSGQYWALDPNTGDVVWVTQVGPGGELGGLQWGSATDGRRIYTAVTNSQAHEWELVENGAATGTTTTGSFWSALDTVTGTILWQTPEPNGALAQGAVSVSRGVVFAGSLSAGPDDATMFALDARTGEFLWRFASGASVNAGAAIVDGDVYWGSGYTRLGLGSGNTRFYAFSVD